MTTLHRLLIAAMLAFVCTGLAIAQELKPVANPAQLGFSPDRLKRLTTAYQGYVDRGELPGAVLLIARNGQIAYLNAVGYQDREKKVPMAVDSIFRLASMTKPIVSIGVMMLVEEGRIDLVAPVSQYIPEFADLKVGVEKTDPGTGKADLVLESQRRPMTVQDLLRHTSGLVYGQFGDQMVHKLYREAEIGNRKYTLAEMMTKLSKLPLAHQPGEVWEYSVSTDVLGRIIEVVSGQPLDQFVAERITGPLGMTGTGFFVRETDLARLAEPQADPTTKERPTIPDVTRKPAMLSGGGGLVAPVNDFLRFAEMLMNGGARGDVRLVGPHTIALMTADALKPGIRYSARAETLSGDSGPTPAMGQGFGLGFAVRTAEGRNPMPGSVGSYYWNGAWGTAFWIDPAEKLIAIQMIQVGAGPSASTYRRAFRNLVYQALVNRE